ncbi:hypothetical protein [Krasilnikovia sp. MM14-A1004]|uniref:hypothetical protein n=1 Tax=Krasilnikovia sp. MM14-A1004 TaxID=3373541 RepID=UPI00399C5306
MESLADRLGAAVDRMTTVDRSLASMGIPAGAFAADEAGLPGRLGRAVYAHWSAVLAARSREAAEAAAGLADLAQDLRATEQGYTEIDEAVGRRVERHGPLWSAERGS